MPIHCEVVSQDRIVFQGDAEMVLLPGVEGFMGILPNHTPMLTVLQYGVITVRTKGEEQFFAVAGGIAEVQPGQVTILADAAENVDDIDVMRAEAARQRAEEALQKVVPSDTDRFLLVQSALRRSNLRLEAVHKYKHGHRPGAD